LVRAVSGRDRVSRRRGKKQQRLETKSDKKRREIDESNAMVDGNTHREPGRPVETGGYDGEGRTPQSGGKCFAGDGSSPFPWTGGADQEKTAEWPLVRRAPSTLRAKAHGPSELRRLAMVPQATIASAPLPNSQCPLWFLVIASINHRIRSCHCIKPAPFSP